MGLLSTLAQSYNYDYNTSYNSYNSADSAAGAAVMLVFGIFWLLFAVALYVVYAIFLSKIFKKAGVKGWKAWVPIYNTWVLLELGGQPGFWAILAFIPVVNIVAVVFMFIAMYHIGLRFGKEGVFVLLAIFLPIVWVIWLAVDKTAVWRGPVTATAQTNTQGPANQPPIAS